MLNKNHFITVGLLAALAAGAPAIMMREGETVVDDKGWELATINNMDGTLEVLTDGGTHPPIYDVNVLRPGSGLYDMHLEKSVDAEAIKSGKPMWLRFKARAAAPRKIRTALQDAKSEPWTQEVQLSSDWKEYKLPFNPSKPTQGDAKLAFQVGGTSGEVSITEIRLVRS